jgi:hypothetical protein
MKILFITVHSRSGNLSGYGTLELETIGSPKRRFELVLHSTKSQKTYLIDTAMKASQKTVVFQYSATWLFEAPPILSPTISWWWGLSAPETLRAMLVVA